VVAFIFSIIEIYKYIQKASGESDESAEQYNVEMRI